MNVLSLFDGISGARLALDEANIQVNNYYASEIDKYAMKISQENCPDIIQLGDIVQWEAWDLPKIDLLIAGSPCQGFSFAGKQLNFGDPRSVLFFKYVAILKHVKPKYFLLENVRMKQEHQDIISALLGVKPIMINSSLLTAQNRVRLYWTNIPNVTQPDNKGILLKDILEDGITDRAKAHCLDANYFKGGNLKSYFEKHRRQLVFTGGALRGRYTGDGSIQQQLECRSDNKSNCLTTVTKDSLCIQIGEADLNGNESIRRVYSPDGKSPTLTTCGGGHREPKINIDNITWRKLTPLECERLQGVPDNYTNHVSNSQRYKALGNGFTIPIIAHILKSIA